MRTWRHLILFSFAGSVAFAQLTMDQKISDFQALAGLYAKRYGPYEWKRDTLNFDLLQVGPWLAKVQATTDDLDFYEVMVEYVASLNDAHDAYTLPASFVANLNFGVDIYDGKLLVDFINRNRLPASEFGFLIGYELVSIDGQDAQKLLDGFLRYNIAANPRSTRRLAASTLTVRGQVLMPHAAAVPEISTVVFRRTDGRLETHRIPWTKSGLQLTTVGRYTTPRATLDRPVSPTANDTDGSAAADGPPAYVRLLNRLQNIRLPDRAVTGFGSQFPVFMLSLPTTFEQRLGKVPTDVFFSGVFTASGYKIGFIRIPNYEPVNGTTALTTFAKEIAYFQENTDGLVVDQMRNPGGSGSYMNAIVSYLMPSRWQSVGFELRATSEWVLSISSSVTQAKAAGAPQEIVDLLQKIQDEIVSANRQMRGRTAPLPLDDVTIDRDPAKDAKGNVVAYTKPLIVLVDEMSASGGDAFPATIQDNARGPIVGWRTMGAGGNVEAWEGGSYSLGMTTVTESLMHRNHTIITSDYPPAPYVENVGVRPDIEVDYMTRDNLLQNGRPFVDAFVNAVLAEIQKSK